MPKEPVLEKTSVQEDFESRRKDPRVDLEVDVDLDAYGEYFLSKLANVSSGGAFIKTQNLINVNSNIKLKFKLPGDSQPIEAEGLVIWTYNQAGNEHDNASGMGIRFTQILQSDRDKIRSFVQDKLAQIKLHSSLS